MLITKARIRNINVSFIIVIAAYAFDIGNLKYILAWLFILTGILGNLRANNGTLQIKRIGKEYIAIFVGTLILFVITGWFQFVNGFNSYAINEFVYYTTPLLFTLTYVQHSTTDDIVLGLDWAFCIFVISFFVKYYKVLSVKNILSISFVHSYSPFESELAFIFLIFEFLYLYEKKRGKAIISLALCLLSFKRMCAVVAVMVFVFSKWCMIKKSVNKKYVLIATAIFIIIPVIVCFILNNTFETWFYQHFGISLHEVTLSRSERIEMVLATDEIKYGLGSVTTFITKALNEIHGSNIQHRNLHNDLIQIYLECGLIGSISFTFSNFLIFSKSRMSFILMIYIFSEMFFNHLLGAGCTQIWILIYLMLAITCEEKLEVNQCKNIKQIS